MLSVGKVATATRYYEQTDDYYTTDRAPSAWAGKGAEALGLAGEVDSQTFQELLEGQMPDGTKIHVGGGARRGGTDLTFSAPKSVSIEALVHGDARLLKAHDEAVATVTGFIEQRVRTRKGERTGQLVAATFRHERSREGDPQGHTHVVILNATRDASGKWRALDHRPFYTDKMMLGAMYRAELARNVQALGYGIRLTHGDGRFELAHVSDAQITTFSQRSQQIEHRLARQGLSRESASGAQKAVAATATRRSKGVVDLQALRAEWQARAREAGLDPEFHRTVSADQATEQAAARARERSPAEDAKQAGFGTAETAGVSAPSQTAQAAVDYAIAHTTEREGTVAERDLLRHALEFATGKVGAQVVVAALDDRVKNGELERRGDHVASSADIAREESIIGLMRQGQGGRAPIASASAAKAVLDSGAGTPGALNDGQRAAVKLITTSADAVVGVQGRAGTGKTTMLGAVRELAAAQDRPLTGLGPSGRAVRELESAGIASRTIASFLKDEAAQQALSPRDVLVVDEAAMVSAKQMHALVSVAEAAKAKVVLIGDSRQLKSVEAGRPFEQLQQAGMPTATMEAIQRQRDPVLRQAVQALATGDTGQALQTLAPSIREIADRADRHAAIAASFAALKPAEQAATLVVTGTNEARESLNAAIRGALGRNGTGSEVQTLRAVDMTAAQAKRAALYQPGMVVEAQRDYRSLGIERGAQFQVESVEAGKVSLKGGDGRRLDWSPARQTGFKAFEAVTREIAVGDRVQFSVGNQSLGVKNRDLGTVTAMADGGLSIRLDAGRDVSLPAGRAHHLDHGYATTTYGSQGATVDRVLVDLDTQTVATSRNAAYVQVSRARSEAQIFTDDVSRLANAIGREAVKTAALDVRGPDAVSAAPAPADAQPASSPPIESIEPNVLDKARDRLQAMVQFALERMRGREGDGRTSVDQGTEQVTPPSGRTTGDRSDGLSR